MSPAESIGSVGVGLLLLAFFLNVVGFTDRSRAPYQAMNAVGAGLACYASFLIDFVPFVILEGTWALVAVAALVRTRFGGSRLST